MKTATLRIATREPTLAEKIAAREAHLAEARRLEREIVAEGRALCRARGELVAPSLDRVCKEFAA